MNYLSVCSGVEAASVAWKDLGWTPLAFSEIDPFASAVLKHHYPNVPNLGDMTNYKEWNFGEKSVDVLVGGTPCQSFSVAGLRKGLEDPRGNLALIYLGIIEKFRPKYIVWENVPGVLSSARGRDFGSFIGGLQELGYSFAWRILDAQFFGVAQRRRRVFVVGCIGTWKSAIQFLFESESLRGDSTTSKKKREDLATKTRTSLTYNDRTGKDGTVKPIEVSNTVTAFWGTGGNNTPITTSFNLTGFGSAEEGDVSATLRAAGGDISGGSENLVSHAWPAEIASTLNASFADKQGLEDQHVFNGAPLFVQDVASTLTARDFKGPTSDCTNVIAFSSNMSVPDTFEDVAPSLKLGGSGGNNPPAISIHPQATQFSGGGENRNDDGKGNGLGINELDVSYSLTGGQTQSVCFAQNSRDEVREMPYSGALSANPGMKQTSYVFEPGSIARNAGPSGEMKISGTLRADMGDNLPAVRTKTELRRLVPIETERLQGFPDNYTQIPWRNKPKEECPNGPRYKVMGNSMAVPVMRWIGENIQRVEDDRSN